MAKFAIYATLFVEAEDYEQAIENVGNITVEGVEEWEITDMDTQEL